MNEMFSYNPLVNGPILNNPRPEDPGDEGLGDPTDEGLGDPTDEGLGDPY